MKKAYIALVGLVIADQLIKYIIVTLWPGVHVSLIPGVLAFAPVQNIHLSWISSMANFRTPVVWMVLGQAAAAALVILASRYLTYLDGSERNRVIPFVALALAGIACSFCDVVFWGGSWDYLRLFNWFTFDLKDVYLTTFTPIALLIYSTNITPHSRLSPEENKQQSFLRWLRSGCPRKRSN